MVDDDSIVHPQEASQSDLLVVHPKRYLDRLKVHNTLMQNTFSIKNRR